MNSQHYEMKVHNEVDKYKCLCCWARIWNWFHNETVQNWELDNPGNNFEAMIVLQSMSCDSIKTELLKIRDKAENDTVATFFDEKHEVKDNETVFENHKEN